MRRGRVQHFVTKILAERGAATLNELAQAFARSRGYTRPTRSHVESVRRAAHRLAERGAVRLAYDRAGQLVVVSPRAGMPPGVRPERPVRDWRAVVPAAVVDVLARGTAQDVRTWLGTLGRPERIRGIGPVRRAVRRGEDWIPASFVTDAVLVALGFSLVSDHRGSVRRAVRQTLERLAAQGLVELWRAAWRGRGLPAILAVRVRDSSAFPPPSGTLPPFPPLLPRDRPGGRLAWVRRIALRTGLAGRPLA